MRACLALVLALALAFPLLALASRLCEGSEGVKLLLICIFCRTRPFFKDLILQVRFRVVIIPVVFSIICRVGICVVSVVVTVGVVVVFIIVLALLVRAGLSSPNTITATLLLVLVAVLGAFLASFREVCACVVVNRRELRS